MIDNKFDVISYEIMSHSVSRIIIDDRENNKYYIYGAWIPFDDNSPERLAIIQSTLSLLESELFVNENNNVIIIGDFNCDLARDKRYDRLLARFIDENSLVDAVSLFDQKCDYTYSNKSYKATIDHIIVNDVARSTIEGCFIINNPVCVSDHKAIECVIRSRIIHNDAFNSDAIREKNVHRFPWTNEFFVDKYASLLDRNVSEFIMTLGNLGLSRVDFIDQICAILPKIMIKVARDAERSCGLSTSNSVRRNQRVINLGDGADRIISEIKRIVTLDKEHRELECEKLRMLRRDLRRMQRRSVFENGSNRALRLDSMLRLDKAEFWRKISAFRRKNKDRARVTNKQPSARDFIDFYSDLFSHNDRVSNSEHIIVEEEVERHFNELKYMEYNLTLCDKSIIDSINELKTRKASGVDGTCNEMFKCGGNLPKSLIYLLKVFYSSILNTGHIPSGLGVSLLKPIPKKGQMCGPSDYRPISISNVLATIFETILME